VPRPPLPQHIIDVLQRPNHAVMGVVRPDSTPVTVPTWYLWEDGRLLVNMDAERRRLRYVRANPRVSLTVLDGGNWYNHVSVQGRMTLEDDPDLSGIDRLASHYQGMPYPDRNRPRVNGWIDIDFWHAWGELARPL
jgi:PPOX class probable F420-dependent enzyme